MQNWTAYLLMAMSTVIAIVGIGCLTCYGCFSANQSAGFAMGASVFLGICCIIAILISSFPFSWKQQSLVMLTSCGLVSGLIVLGASSNAWMPRTGPRRLGDLYQLASLVPLISISMGLTPFVLRRYRGIQCSRQSDSTMPKFHIASDLICLALMVGGAFAFPLVANLAIQHPNSEAAYFVIFSVACIFVGSVILWPIFVLLMRFSWATFYTASGVGLLTCWLAVAICLGMSRMVFWTPRDIVIMATATTSGPLLITMFLLAIRLMGFHLVIPKRRFESRKSVRFAHVHPLDSI